MPLWTTTRKRAGQDRSGRGGGWNGLLLRYFRRNGLGDRLTDRAFAPHKLFKLLDLSVGQVLAEVLGDESAAGDRSRKHWAPSKACGYRGHSRYGAGRRVLAEPA